MRQQHACHGMSIQSMWKLLQWLPSAQEGLKVATAPGKALNTYFAPGTAAMRAENAPEPQRMQPGRWHIWTWLMALPTGQGAWSWGSMCGMTLLHLAIEFCSCKRSQN